LQVETQERSVPAESFARQSDRYSHICIRLQLRLDGGWEYLEAIGWNAVGFNFYFDRVLQPAVLDLKRGLLHFEGSVAWSAPNADAAVVRAAIVNELIYKRAQSVTSDPALQARLLRLIRVGGRVDDKRQILASLGLAIDDARLAQLVDKRMHERPLYQYGVRVQSDIWAAVVDKALSLSSAVIALEGWSHSMLRK
jgi:hypothetical protein